MIVKQKKFFFSYNIVVDDYYENLDFEVAI